MSNSYHHYAGDTFSIVATALDSLGAPATIEAAAFVMSQGSALIEIAPVIDEATATVNIDQATSLTLSGTYAYAFRTKDVNGGVNTEVGSIVVTPVSITEAI